MKRLLTILAFLLLAAPAYADESMQLARMDGPMLGSVGGVTKTCTDKELFLDASSTDDYISVADGPNSTYLGQADFDPSSNAVICDARINVRNVDDDARDWVVGIAPMSGTGIGTASDGCTSDAVTVSTTGVKTFIFPSGCSVSHGTTYAIYIARSDYSDAITADDGDKIRVYMSSSDNGISGNMRRWDGAKSQVTDYSTREFGFILYAY